jgi:hypothetical protein
VLAGVAAFTFFRAGNRLKQKKRFNAARIVLRFLSAVLLFVVALGVFDEMTDNPGNINTFKTLDSDNIQISDAEGLEVLGITAKYLIQTTQLVNDIERGECRVVYNCWQALGEQISLDIAQLALSKDKARSVLEKFVQASEDSLTLAQRQSLQRHLQNELEHTIKAKRLPSAVLSIDNNQALPTTPAANFEQQADDATVEQDDVTDKESNIIESLKELAEEFGWGVGWALFYFSLITAWWRGQTPGKRLMGIKVIKLDGSVMNLWESFGRYGGYSAGLATGLSGFLQVYWDPNRQAIQDKVSETLVINLRKPKVAFVLPNESDLPEVEN